MIQILTDYLPAFLNGAKTTLALALIGWVIGSLLGVLLGLLVAENPRILGLFRAANFFVTGIPVLVILFWLHYPLQDMLQISIDPFVTSAITFSLLNTLFVASTVAKNSSEIAMGYREAAFLHGMSYSNMLWKIDIPLVLRASLPQIINYQVVILHMTLFASLISVNELFRTAQRINAVEYQPVEIYSLLVIFYALISMPLLLLSRFLTKSQKDWFVAA